MSSPSESGGALSASHADFASFSLMCKEVLIPECPKVEIVEIVVYRDKQTGQIMISLPTSQEPMSDVTNVSMATDRGQQLVKFKIGGSNARTITLVSDSGPDATNQFVESFKKAIALAKRPPEKSIRTPLPYSRGLQSGSQVANRQVAAAQKESRWDKLQQQPPSRYGGSARQGHQNVHASGATLPIVTSARGSTRGSTVDLDGPSNDPFAKSPGRPPQSIFSHLGSSQNRGLQSVYPPPNGIEFSKTYDRKPSRSLEVSPKKSGGTSRLGKNGASTSDPSKLYQSTIPAIMNNRSPSYISSPSRPVPSFIGFRNVGNSCYMGATLRALVSLKSFLSDLGHPRLFSIEEIPSDSFYTNFLALVDVATQKDRKREIDPTPLKKALGKHFQAFAGSQQQDAHEFFIECIGQIEADLYPHLRVKRAQAVRDQLQKLIDKGSNSGKVSTKRKTRRVIHDEDDEESATGEEPEKQAIAPDRNALLPKLIDSGDMIDFETMFCPSKRNFGGVTETRLVCVECGAQRSSRELIRDISVEVFDKEELCQMILSMNARSDGEATEKVQQRIHDPPTVENLMEYFFTSETVESRCEADGCSSTTAVLTRRLLRPPRVLAIHLKRFRVDYQRQRLDKICEQIDITEKLDISPFVSTTANFARPIPFNADEYQRFEQNRQARLDKMMKASAARKSSAPVPKSQAPAYTSGAKVNSTDIEPPAKRQKLSDDQPLGQGNFFDFQNAENKASQDTDDLLELSTRKEFSAPQSSFYSSGHVRMMDDDIIENTPSPKDKDTSVDLVGDDMDDELKKALAASKAEAEAVAERQKKEEEEMIRQAIAESEKQQNYFMDYEPIQEEQSEDTQEDMGTFPRLQDPGTKMDVEVSETSVDLKTDPTGAAKEDLDDSSTAPPSPRRLQDLEELEKQLIFPGSTCPFPEAPPDPFWTDELRSSETLEPSKATPSNKYRLMTIIHHIGASANHGHYVTDVYSPEDESWTHHDDSRVVEVVGERNPGDFLKQRKNRETAYLLFYVHEDCIDKATKKQMAKKASASTAQGPPSVM